MFRSPPLPKVLTALLTVLTLSSMQDAKAQTYHFQHYGPDNGLTQHYIYDITSLYDGNIALATDEGLVKYNGKYFTTENANSGLTEDFCHTLHQDARKRLWIGHFQEGITRITGQNKRSFTATHFQGNRVQAVQTDSRGNAWIASIGGLFRMDGDSIGTAIEGTPEVITDFLIVNDTFYIAGDEQLHLYRLHDDHRTLIPVATPEALKTIAPTALLYVNNLLFVGTPAQGIYCLQNQQNTLKIRYRIDLPRLEETQPPVLHIEKGHNHSLWVNTRTAGLIKIAFTDSTYHSWQMRRFTRQNGLRDAAIQAIHVDPEGNLWIGYYGEGLARLTHQDLMLFNTFGEAPTASIHAITSGPNHFLWLGSDAGLIRFGGVNDNYPDFFGKAEGFIDGKVNALYADSTSSLWIGTEDHGIWKLDLSSNRFIDINKKYQINARQINVITANAEGKLFFGTTLGMYIFDPATETFDVRTMEDNLVNNLLYDIHIDAADQFWYAAHGVSLFKYYDGKYKIYKDIPQNTFNKLNAVTTDQAGNAWFGTLGNGVFHQVQEDSFGHIGVKEGLLSQYCYDILCDRNNEIWVTHRNGVSRLTADQHIIHYNKENGFVSEHNNHNATYRDPNGTLWFGTQDGLVLYDPSASKTEQAPPVLTLKGVSVNDAYTHLEDADSSAHDYPYKTYNFAFHFSAIHQTHPDKVTVTCMLEGYDRQMRVLQGDQTVIEYPKLREGTYKLTLQAHLNDEIRSEKMTYSFTIGNPVWKQVWFYVVIGLLFLGMTYLYSSWRTRKVRLANIKLERVVLEKTQELRKEKHNLEQAKAELEEKNNDIMDSINYAERIQSAILPDLSFADTHVADGALFFQPRDVVSGDFYWFTQKNDVSLFAACDCTGHGVPGAFMSMIGTTLLNKIVNEQGETDVVKILESLDANIISSLHQKGVETDASDGMDMAIIAVYPDKKVVFAGAMRPMYLKRKAAAEVEVISGSIASIGGVHHLGKHSKTFDKQTFQLEAGDLLYIFSDGIVDQFGGPKDKKFMPRRLQAVLESASSESCSVQIQRLSEVWNEWKGEQPQTDDALLLCVRL